MASTKQVAFRLDQNLVRQIDTYAQILTKETPGMTFTRADVVRMLVSKGIKEAGVSINSSSEKRKATKR